MSRVIFKSLEILRATSNDKRPPGAVNVLIKFHLLPRKSACACECVAADKSRKSGGNETCSLHYFQINLHFN